MPKELMSKIAYRPEIDGLRALAVLSVLFYHADFAVLSGGYVGVDIFFVISGYLITSIIYAELLTGTFSFRMFWLRRTRRILPAAYLVMATTALAFLFVYPDIFYRDFGKSLAAQSVFGSNIYYWMESGYFESASELKLLLHTWSLAVEEQFYLFYPFILWVCFSFFRVGIRPILFVGCLASLALSVWGTYEYPEASFYLLPTRAWELGLGALVGLATPRAFTTNTTINNLVSASGMGMIVIALFSFDNNTPFPSYNAILPVMGTCALIWANTNTRTVIGRLLSLKPVVGIGLISYSLYLWHWPVIIFSNWVFAPEPSLFNSLILFVVSITFAYLTYRYVETPLRVNKQFFTNRKIVIGSLIGSMAALFAGMAIGLIGNSYLVDRDGQITRFYQMAMEPEPNREKCSDFSNNDLDSRTCRLLGNPKSSSIDVFLWGDSHGGALIPALIELAKVSDYNIEYGIRHGCQPVFGMRRVDGGSYKCPEFSDQMIAAVHASKPQVVLLVGSFVNNITIGKYRDVHSDYSIDGVKSMQEFEARFPETIARIKSSGAKALVFTEPPRLEKNPVNDYLRRRTLGLTVDGDYVDKKSHLARIEKIYSIIDNAGIDSRLDYTDFFCADSKCKVRYNEQSLYKDASHISNFGAKSLSPLLRQDLEKYLQTDISRK